MRIPVEPSRAPKWSPFWQGTEWEPPSISPVRGLAVLSFVGFALLAATSAFNYVREWSYYESCAALNPGLSVCSKAQASWLIGLTLWGGLAGGVVLMLRNPLRASRGAWPWPLPFHPFVGLLVGNLALAVALIPLASAQVLPPGVDLTLQLLFVTLGLHFLAFVSVSTVTHRDPWSQVAFVLGLVQGGIGLALAVALAAMFAAPPLIT